MFLTLLAAVTLAPVTLSVHVEGEGYMRFAHEGRVVYATQATLHVEGEHLLAGKDVEFLPNVAVPNGTEAVEIDLEGSVLAVVAGKKYPVAHLVLALFPKGSTLTPQGGFLLASDRPSLGNPGDGTNGVIRVDSPASGVKTQPQAVKQVPTTATSTATKSPQVHANTNRKYADGEAEIQIHQTSTVAGESFTLAEIADIGANPELAAKLGPIDMGRSPAVGVQRGIDRNFIMSKIRNTGLKPEGLSISCPSSAQILRACQKVDKAQLLEAATAAVKEQLGIDMPMRVTNDVPDATVPPGQLELRAANAIKGTNGITLMIDIRVDDKHFTSRNLLLSPMAGTGIGVRMGQAVKIIVRVKGASVEIGGKARGAAWVGQTVTVVTDTGAVKTGVVTGPDTVEVKL
jgi:hypothetical protein